MGKSLRLPGFGFRPTSAVLVMYYLKRKLLGKKLDPEVIAAVNICDFNPWDLPAKSILTGDLEWYFFSSNSISYGSRKRKNRTTEAGFWRGTGNDTKVKYRGRIVAMRKTLVFYVGRSPKGTRTNWVMHEYWMTDEDLADKGVAQEAYLLCRVFEKSGLGPKNGEEYGAPFKEEDWDDDGDDMSTETSSIMVGVLVNRNNVNCSRMVNMTSPAPGPSTVTPSAKMLYPNAGTSAPSTVTPSAKMLYPNAGTSIPSTITYGENERLTYVLVHDNNADVASLQNNNNAQEVEDPKGKKVMTIPVNESDVTFQENDLGLDAFNMFDIDIDGSVDDNMFDIDGTAADDSLDAFDVDEFLNFPED